MPDFTKGLKSQVCWLTDYGPTTMFFCIYPNWKATFQAILDYN